MRWLVPVVLVSLIAACGGGSDDKNNDDGSDSGNSSNGGSVRSPKADIKAGPLGKLAYVTRDGLTLVDVSNGASKVIPFDDTINGGVTASKDGHLALLTEPEVSGVARIVVLDGDGNTIGFFQKSFDGFNLTGASISPDGTKVAFGVYERDDDGTFARVYASNIDGTNLQFLNVTPYVTDDGVSQSYSAGVTWTADNHLVVTTPSYIMVANDLDVFSPVGPSDLAQPSNPAMSPDGRYIVFDQSRGANIGDGGSSFRAVWSLDTQTGNVTQLTRGVIEQYFPTVSPDGSTLLFGDSSPFAVGNIGAFDRSYLQAIPFTQSVLDISDADASVRDTNGDPIEIFGRAALY